MPYPLSHTSESKANHFLNVGGDEILRITGRGVGTSMPGLCRPSRVECAGLVGAGQGRAWALGPDAGPWASLQPSAMSDPGLRMSTHSGAWSPGEFPIPMGGVSQAWLRVGVGTEGGREGGVGGCYSQKQPGFC